MQNEPSDTNADKLTETKQLAPEEQSGAFLVNLTSKEELYQAYMPFIQNGALFIQTDKEYTLGDEVFLLVQLMDEVDKYPVAGEVVWITPKCAQSGRFAGIGVQLTVDEGSDELRKKIETHLAGAALQSERHTDTM